MIIKAGDLTPEHCGHEVQFPSRFGPVHGVLRDASHETEAYEEHLSTTPWQCWLPGTVNTTITLENDVVVDIDPNADVTVLPHG